MIGNNLFKGITDLLLQVLTLVIYVPKTLYKILKDPRWVPNYVSEESLKKEGYQEYVAPVFLYLVITLLPYALVPISELTEIDKNASLSEILQDDDTVMRVAIFIGIPLVFAFFTELFKSATFNRSTLEQNFRIQCYYFSPLVLLVQLRWVLEITGGYLDFPQLHYLILPLISIVGIWFLLVQYSFLNKILEGNNKNVFTVILISIILIFVFTDPIGLKISESWFKSEWVKLGILILLVPLITTLYLLALLKRYITWKNRKTKRSHHE